MTHVAPVRIVAAARADLGAPAPKDTCCSAGMNKWPQDAGLPGIDTNSVTEARDKARAGYHGWSYHEGLAGVRPGDYVDWAGYKVFHVSQVESVDEHGNIRSIGAGGPTGKVWWQPQNQGHNKPATFKGYFRPPTDDGRKPDPKPATKPVRTVKPKPKPATAAPVRGRRYEVQNGDTLVKIARARRTSVAAIVRRNRGLIRDRGHIEAGWVLELP